MALWLPWAKNNVSPVTSGTYTEGRMKLLIHTTETDTFTPNSRKYYGHSGWPHLTIEKDGTVWQHIDLDIAARALKNLAGGVQTNRSRVVQVENVARSTDGANPLTNAQIEALRRLVVLLHGMRGLELQALPAGAIPGSARVNAPQRMSFAQWRSYSGVIGHRHAPENDHWDPGAFDLRLLLPASTPVPEPKPEPKEDDDMIRFGDKGLHVRQYEFLLNRFFTDTGGPPSTNWLPKRGEANQLVFDATWEAILRLSEPQPGWAGTGQFDFVNNGYPSPAALRAEGITPVLIAALAAAAAIK